MAAGAADIFFFLVLVLLLLLLQYFLLVIRRKVKNPSAHVGKIHLAPGPQGLPVVGNLFQLRQPLHRCFSEMAIEHGPLVQLRFGRSSALVVSSAELAKEVLKTQDLAFCSRPFLTSGQKLSYGGLDIANAPYGDRWRQLRKLYAVELFGAKKHLSFRAMREEEVDRMIGYIRSMTTKKAAIVDVTEVVHLFSLSMTLRMVFGSSGGERSSLHDMLTELVGLLISTFAEDFFPGFVGRTLDGVRGMRRRLDGVFRRQDGMFEEMIAEHKARIRRRQEASATEEQEEKEEEDFIDVLLRLKEEQPNYYLTEEHIKGALANAFVGGTDTTSSILTWAMAELANNGRAMKKACREVRTAMILKRKADAAGAAARVEEEDLARLPYLKAVISETLRMHAPVPLLMPRMTTRRCKLGGYDVLPDTTVYVNVWAIGRDPAYWESPDEFSPERFMEEEDGGGGGVDFKGQCFQLLPFGSGRRMCPGMQMGATAVELAIANLLYAFDWEVPGAGGSAAPEEGGGGVDMEEAVGMVVHKKEPLCLVATPFHYVELAI